MDLGDSTAFTTPTQVSVGDYPDCHNADIVVFTAGANQRPGESRLDLTEKNYGILREVISKLIPCWRGGLLLVVTNPVDVLTYATKLCGLEPSRVLGSGTILDSARFRYALSKHTGVDARSIYAYVTGEHGDSAAPLWSRATVAGIHLDDLCRQRESVPPDKEAITNAIRQAAHQIIERKGATYYAIGPGIRRICEAILKDQKSVLTVSGLCESRYGYRDTAFSLPTVVGENGRGIALELPPDEEEDAALQRSAATLKGTQERLGL